MTPLRILGAWAIIFVTLLVVYAPAVQGGFLWDDDAHITRPDLRSWHGLYRIWFELRATQQYYPLLHSAFWIEHQLWGDHPLGYHLVNLLLHATAALLVFMIARKLRIPGALLAAAIFALHPVQVESVAWITEQKNTLSAVFYLSAMLAYLHFDQTRQPAVYAGALGLFILGLLSKTVIATLPAALLVIFWWQRGRLSQRRDIRPLIPFFVLGAVAGLFTAWVEQTLGGIEGAAYELSLLQRSLLAGQAIWFYLAKLIWPVNLIFIYPRWQIQPDLWWQWVFPVAAIAVVAALWFVRRRWRAPLAGWLFFVGTLFPALGFFNIYPFVYSFVADHFQYLGCLGMIVLAAGGLARAISRLSPPSRWIGNALCAALLAALAALTARQAEMYSDAVALYQTTIDRNPNCWMAYNNLGVQFADSGRSEEALASYQQALKLKPDYTEAYYNMGLQLAKRGQPQLAIECYRQALRIRSKFPAALTSLGNALLDTGHPDQAVEQYRRALEINPDYVMANFNLGNSSYSAGRLDEAIEYYRQALRNGPEYAEAHYNLGTALAKAGKIPEAIEEFERTVELKPDFAAAQNNLGNALLDAGRPAEAVEHFRQALRLKPDDGAFCLNLSKTYAALHRSAEAIATADEFLEKARSTGQTELAAQIEAWLTEYRTEQAQAPHAAPTSDLAPQSPSR